MSRASEVVPVFIVGCGRSGTTMLRLMLDSHPDLAIPGESHFVPELHRTRGRYHRAGILNAGLLATRIMGTVHFRRWELPQELVWRRINRLENPDFGEALSAVYAAYADHRGKPRWGDKTPIYVRHLPLLANLFPEARFVHVIRDGRDVALSYLSVPWGPRSIWEAARKWRLDVSAGRTAGAALGELRYLELRYEDVVSHPRTSLQKVCDFADLPFDEGMLEYHSSAPSRLQAGPQGLRFHGSATRPPTPGLRDWRMHMPERDVMAFESVAGNLLAELGYPSRFEGIPLGWRVKAALWRGVLGLRVAGSIAKRRSLERLHVRSGEAANPVVAPPPATG